MGYTISYYFSTQIQKLGLQHNGIETNPVFSLFFTGKIRNYSELSDISLMFIMPVFKIIYQI